MPAAFYPLAELDNLDPDGTPRATGGTMRGGPARGVVHTNAGRRSARPYYHIWFGSRPVGEDRGPVIVQYRPFTKASRALRNLTGGVQTNRQGDYCINLAMEGKAGNPDGRHPVVYESVRVFMRWAENEFGIVNTYPASKVGVTASECYGYSSQCRFTAAEWRAWGGWCGHQNVPENTHWDPGGIPWDALMGDTPIVQMPPPVPVPPSTPPEAPTDMYLPIKYGDGYVDPPADSDYVGQNRAHRKPDVQYLQLIAGSGVDAGYYGPGTAADVANALQDGSDGRTVGYAEWDRLMARRYDGGPHIHEVGPPI